MKNPWTEIKLDEYEKHMSLDSVYQLQAMNQMMKEQLYAHSVKSVMILGIAGGNGLENKKCIAQLVLRYYNGLYNKEPRKCHGKASHITTETRDGHKRIPCG